MTAKPWRMKRFSSREILQGIEYAKSGGQALHVWKGCWPNPKPRCFKDGEPWGHLLDQDAGRLLLTALHLGVKMVKISNPGKQTQHVDLCGRPLERAMKECKP
ncbi:MAG: hypothetical protein ABSA67_10215 [Candidatus Brocadiia bacterium]